MAGVSLDGMTEMSPGNEEMAVGLLAKECGFLAGICGGFWVEMEM